MASIGEENRISISSFECLCSEKKKFRVEFDGASTGNYIIEYCEKCYDSDDKQFMISMEELF
jgi:hypothetical protein